MSETQTEAEYFVLENAWIDMALHDIDELRGKNRESVQVFREFYRAMKARVKPRQVARAHHSFSMTSSRRRRNSSDFDGFCQISSKSAGAPYRERRIRCAALKTSPPISCRKRAT